MTNAKCAIKFDYTLWAWALGHKSIVGGVDNPVSRGILVASGWLSLRSTPHLHSSGLVPMNPRTPTVTNPSGLFPSIASIRSCRHLLLVGRDLAAAYRFLQDNDFASGVAMITLFVRDIGLKQRLRSELGILFESAMPAVTFVAQAPCDGAPYWFEIVAFEGEGVRLERSSLGRAAVAQFVRSGAPPFRLHFVGDVVPPPAPFGAYARSRAAWDELHLAIQTTGTDLESVVRTWIYQGHLVDTDTNADGAPQRYRELNRSRADFFDGRRFLTPFLPPTFSGTVFPASTGIGGDDWDVTMSALAVSGAPAAVQCVPLENPQQDAAFDYAAHHSPQSPRFVRAMTLTQDDFGWIFVSGTASITASESQHIDNPTAQTHQTLDNIAALIAQDNLTRHGVQGAATLDDLAVARVYVKRPSDAAAIEAACRERMPRVPMVFTGADVCRPELLVEIEGWARIRR